jgi:hypothetical protein
MIWERKESKVFFLLTKNKRSDKQHAENAKKHNDLAERTQVSKILFHVGADETDKEKDQREEEEKHVIAKRKDFIDPVQCDNGNAEHDQHGIDHELCFANSEDNRKCFATKAIITLQILHVLYYFPDKGHKERETRININYCVVRLIININHKNGKSGKNSNGNIADKRQSF